MNKTWIQSHSSRIIFHSRFLFTCSEMDSLVCLTSANESFPCNLLKNPLKSWPWCRSGLFFFFQLQTKVDKRPFMSSLTHHALAVLVLFTAMMSQPLFNCRGAIGPVWHEVCCWHHLLSSWTVSREVLLSQPKWFASEWMFQAVQIAVIFFFFFFFFFNTLCYVSGTLEWGIISFFIFLLFRLFPCSVYFQFSQAFSFNYSKASKITSRCSITILLSSLLRYACRFPAYVIGIIWLACASVAKISGLKQWKT